MAKNNLWLGVREDSELGKLLIKLNENPVAKTADVVKGWNVVGKGGKQSLLNRSRASFILDAIADATEESRKSGAHRVRHGVVKVTGVRENLRADAPGHLIPTYRENTTNVLPVAIERSAQTIADAIKDATPEQTKKDVSEQPTPGRSFVDGGIEFVFPDAPVVDEPRTNYVVPDWYERMADRLEREGSRERHVSFAGPPGVGKSTAPAQWAAKTNRPCIVIGASGGLRLKDVTGSVELDKGSTRFIVANYAAAAIFGWTVIIDEVNAADADVLLFLNGQLAAPYEVQLHGRSFPVHPDFRCVVTYNPGLTGTKPLPPAFKDRFFPIKLAFPESTLLRKILVANGMPANAVYADKLLTVAAAAWAAHERGHMRYQITPRRLFDTVYLMEQATGYMGSTNMMAKTLYNALTDALLAAVDDHRDAATLKGLLDAQLNPSGTVW